MAAQRHGEEKAEAKKKAEALEADRRGQDFATVARQSSEDPEAKAKGGDFGLGRAEGRPGRWPTRSSRSRPAAVTQPIETPNAGIW